MFIPNEHSAFKSHQKCSRTEDGESTAGVAEPGDGKEITRIPINKEERQGRKRVGDTFRSF